jgi:hypothetical protein
MGPLRSLELPQIAMVEKKGAIGHPSFIQVNGWIIGDEGAWMGTKCRKIGQNGSAIHRFSIQLETWNWRETAKELVGKWLNQFVELKCTNN